MGVAIINYIQVQKWVWQLLTILCQTFIAMMDDQLIVDCLRALASALCTDLFVAAVLQLLWIHTLH